MADYSNFNNFTVPTVDFRQNRWKPQELQFEQPDMNIHSQALARFEQRKQDSITQRSAFDETLSKLKDNIGDDDESRQWFENFSAKYREEIDQYSRAGDYGRALEAAKRASGAILTDKEYLDRKANWESYKKQRQAIEDNKGLNEVTKKRWLETHAYSYKKNKQGEWGLEKDKFDTPVADIDWAKDTAFAMGIAQAETRGDSRETQTNNSSSKTNADGTSRGSGRESTSIRSSSVTELTYDKLRANVTQYFAGGYARKQAQQDYDNQIYEYEKKYAEFLEMDGTESDYESIAAEIDHMKKLLFDQAGHKRKLDDYIFDMTESYCRTAAKKDVTASRVSRSGTSNTENNYKPERNSSSSSGASTQQQQDPYAEMKLGIDAAFKTGTPISYKLKGSDKIYTISSNDTNGYVEAKELVPAISNIMYGDIKQ